MKGGLQHNVVGDMQRRSPTQLLYRDGKEQTETENGGEQRPRRAASRKWRRYSSNTRGQCWDELEGTERGGRGVDSGRSFEFHSLSKE